MPPLNLFKGNFGKKETLRKELQPEEVPDLLAGIGKDAREEFRSGMQEPMQEVLAAREELKELMEHLHSVERDKAFHPKLEKIAVNSLPLFEKAISSSLSRPLPEEPEEFYDASAESLKGMVKALTGPGRYLTGVLPEEMKAVKSAVNRVGRAMNSMNPLITAYRAKKETIERLSSITEEYRSVTDGISVIDRQVPVMEEEIRRTEDAMEGKGGTGTEVSGAEEDSLTRLKEERASVESRLGEKDRELRSLFAVVIHVLRKGEKIAHRNNDSLAREIHEVIRLLEGKELPTYQELSGPFSHVVGLVASMVKSGEITLKNKEEKELFGQAAGITARVEGLLSDISMLTAQCGEVQKQIEDHPSTLRTIARQEESQTLQDQHEILVNEKNALLNERKSLMERSKTLRESLKAGLEELLGMPVTITG
jgi:predicted  nucleic acid-binding Zn-ribbon protein